jgi:hypothetical protein
VEKELSLKVRFPRPPFFSEDVEKGLPVSKTP